MFSLFLTWYRADSIFQIWVILRHVGNIEVSFDRHGHLAGHKRILRSGTEPSCKVHKSRSAKFVSNIHFPLKRFEILRLCDGQHIGVGIVEVPAKVPAPGINRFTRK